MFGSDVTGDINVLMCSMHRAPFSKLSLEQAELEYIRNIYGMWVDYKA